MIRACLFILHGEGRSGSCSEHMMGKLWMRFFFLWSNEKFNIIQKWVRGKKHSRKAKITVSETICQENTSNKAQIIGSYLTGSISPEYNLLLVYKGLGKSWVKRVINPWTCVDFNFLVWISVNEQKHGGSLELYSSISSPTTRTLIRR